MGEVEVVDDADVRAMFEANFRGGTNVSREAVRFFRRSILPGKAAGCCSVIGGYEPVPNPPHNHCREPRVAVRVDAREPSQDALIALPTVSNPPGSMMVIWGRHGKLQVLRCSPRCVRRIGEEGLGRRIASPSVSRTEKRIRDGHSLSERRPGCGVA
ncbi:hypothetical protein LXA43DRAFT_541140 [Ganoderma leucocontextum]|nr:hypothetical protein LXA43DRAFT_541140 [Ganoderma leucocontextum]